MQQPLLSIVIAVRNEQDNLLATLATIRATSPRDSVEIIVCDDASDPPIDPVKVEPALSENRIAVSTGRSFNRFIQFPIRHGHAYCRHYAAIASKGEWLMFTDAHMVFPKGWWETWKKHLPALGERDLACGSYVSLSPLPKLEEWHSTPTTLDGVFGGARFYYYEAKSKERRFELDVIGMEFLPEGLPDGMREVPCVVGASYFIRREWFIEFGGLQGLTGWSTDEWLLSVKTWLCGGRVLLLPDVTIGHINYKGEPGNTSREMPRSDLLYNKLVMAFTTLPEDEFVPFVRYLPKQDDAVLPALVKLEDNRPALTTIRNANLKRFKRDTLWLCGKFGIAHPADLGAENFIVH